MDNQIQAVAQGVPSMPCLLPFIMGCLVKGARAAPTAQIWSGEPAILPKDTLHLPLVARLLINTEDDGPLAGVPTQDDASSDADVNATVSFIPIPLKPSLRSFPSPGSEFNRDRGSE